MGLEWTGRFRGYGRAERDNGRAGAYLYVVRIALTLLPSGEPDLSIFLDLYTLSRVNPPSLSLFLPIYTYIYIYIYLSIHISMYASTSTSLSS